MTNEANKLRERLKQTGLSDAAIDAAWPEWWSDAADPSASSRLDLKFSMARKLGLDARSLVDEDGVPRFVWRDEARFKNLSAETDLECAVIASFGRAVGSLIASTFGQGPQLFTETALNLRQSILQKSSFVGLRDLLALSWACGIPVVHLRVYPLKRKRMAAMCVRAGDRPVILLAKDSSYPAPTAFYLAHELGHILLGHLDRDTAIVDLVEDGPRLDDDDPEEAAADQFALELLTGYPEPKVLPAQGSEYNAPGLAQAVLDASGGLSIEPGTLALCFGFSTGNWAVANSAMSFIYSSPKDVWKEVNKVAAKELDPAQTPEDSVAYLGSVLGAASL